MIPWKNSGEAVGFEDPANYRDLGLLASPSLLYIITATVYIYR
jgi:hypothetical protein